MICEYQHIRLIFAGACDTKDRVIMEKGLAIKKKKTFLLEEINTLNMR